MDPNSQQPQNNPYDFILNSGQTNKSNGFSGGSQKQRIIIVAIIGTFLLIAGTVAFTLISNAGKPNYADNLKIISLQRKLLQTSSTAVEASPSADTRSYAATLNASLTSDNRQMEEFLVKGGQEKLLKSIPNEDQKIEESLTKAASNNNFDAAFNEITNELLNDYVAALRSASSDANSVNEKALLEASFQHVKIIASTEESATQ